MLEAGAQLLGCSCLKTESHPEVQPGSCCGTGFSILNFSSLQILKTIKEKKFAYLLMPANVCGFDCRVAIQRCLGPLAQSWFHAINFVESSTAWIVCWRWGGEAEKPIACFPYADLSVCSPLNRCITRSLFLYLCCLPSSPPSRLGQWIVNLQCDWSWPTLASGGLSCFSQNVQPSSVFLLIQGGQFLMTVFWSVFCNFKKCSKQCLPPSSSFSPPPRTFGAPFSFTVSVLKAYFSALYLETFLFITTFITNVSQTAVRSVNGEIFFILPFLHAFQRSGTEFFLKKLIRRGDCLSF